MTAAVFKRGARIVRSLEKTYTYFLTIHWVEGNYSILPFGNMQVNGNSTEIVKHPRSNFEFSYIMVPTHWTHPNTTINNSKILTAKVALNQTNMFFAEYQTAIIEASITVNVNFEECSNMQFICFFFKNTEISSYTELNLENNVHCTGLGTDKQCNPRKLKKDT